MNRILAKLGSVRAVCLLLLTVTLCVLVFVDGVTWRDCFTGTLGAFIGNYLNRPQTAADPKGGGH